MNIKIIAIPITPALIALGKASSPNWAPTLLIDATSILTGNAPALIKLANVLASSTFELPDIIASPSVIALWTFGFDINSSSI